MKKITTILAFVLLVVSLSARNNTDISVTNTVNKTNLGSCNTPTAQVELDINNVRVLLLSGGDMWWDGLASGASISMRQGIDISNYEDTIINFDWLIERNYDTSDYLAFEVSTDNGSSWAEIKRLRGNIDEARGNPFRNETFRVNNLINDFNLESTGFLNLRFTGTANRGNEDAFFDNVAITGINNIVPVI